MIVGVPKESYPGERRVALVPGVIPNLVKAGLEVVIEAGAGVEAGYPDARLRRQGRQDPRQPRRRLQTADIIVQVLCYGSNDRTGRADVPLFSAGQVADWLPAAARRCRRRCRRSPPPA